LGDAETKAEELLALIGDLLEVARIEETGISLHPVEIAPGALIAELVDEWGVRFRQESAKVSTAVADDAPLFYADRQLIKRLFSNLIQNALTHASHAVSLKIGVRGIDGDVLFSVEDDGPGIALEYQDVIFQKFGRVKSAGVPRLRSTGLGLAFCRLVTEAHAGRIWVRSEVGKGSTFYVQLPNRVQSTP
jgi:signal transduction histidine kinase